MYGGCINLRSMQRKLYSVISIIKIACAENLYVYICICRYGDTSEVQEYNVTTAYRMALETWAKWLVKKINPVKQRVFFSSMSPTHLWYVTSEHKT